MINHQLPSKPLLLFFIFSIIFACQEDSLNEEINLTVLELDQADADMIAASNLANEYLSSSSARESKEKSITILRFKKGKLFFNTNTDNIQGYHEVTEATVTAIVAPGEYLFWYSGSGISDLDGIEFDAASQQQLSNYPEEINSDKMWVIAVPENVSDNTILKYDIIYQFKGNSGSAIRLDPKIKINN